MDTINRIACEVQGNNYIDSLGMCTEYNEIELTMFLMSVAIAIALIAWHVWTNKRHDKDIAAMRKARVDRQIAIRTQLLLNW